MMKRLPRFRRVWNLVARRASRSCSLTLPQHFRLNSVDWDFSARLLLIQFSVLSIRRPLAWPSFSLDYRCSTGISIKRNTVLKLLTQIIRLVREFEKPYFLRIPRILFLQVSVKWREVQEKKIYSHWRLHSSARWFWMFCHSSMSPIPELMFYLLRLFLLSGLVNLSKCSDINFNFTAPCI